MKACHKWGDDLIWKLNYSKEFSIPEWKQKRSILPRELAMSWFRWQGIRAQETGVWSLASVQARILEWVAISFSGGIFPTQGSNPSLLRADALASEPGHC